MVEKENKEKESNNLFMATSGKEKNGSSVWLIDSGCSNHMSGDQRLFRNLDTTRKQMVRLDDDNKI